MIIRLGIDEINYEECFQNLIPQMIADSSSQTELSELEKLLLRLGDDAVPVLNKLLGYFDTDARDQLFVWLLEDNQEMFTSTANDSMKELFAGEAIVIGGLYGQDQPGPKLTLYAKDVAIDYKKLVESPMFSGVLGGAAKIALQISSPEKLEKTGMKLLSSDMGKPTFLSILSDSLQKAGLILTLGDVELLEDGSVDMPAPTRDPSKDEGLIPDAIEDPIIDAIAAWLKDSI